MFKLAILFAQAAPFPTTGSGQVSGVGAIGSNAALAGAKNAGALAASQLNDLWMQLNDPTGSYWLSILKGLSPFLGVGFLLWTGSMALEWLEAGRVPWKKYLSPFLVVIMLSQNGLYLAASQNAARNLLYGSNNAMLDAQIGGTTGRLRIQQNGQLAGYFDALQAKTAACDAFSGQQKDDCLANAIKAAEEFRQGIQPTQAGVPNISFNPLQAIANAGGAALKLAIVGALVSILTVSAYAFHLVFAYLLTVWASLAPMWLSLHLLPFPTPGLKMLLAGWMACALGMLSYTALSISAAYVLSITEDSNPLIYPLFTGLFNPILAIGLAASGFFGAMAGAGAVARVFSGGVAGK